MKMNHLYRLTKKGSCLFSAIIMTSLLASIALAGTVDTILSTGSTDWSYLHVTDAVDPSIADTDFDITWFNPTIGGYIGSSYDGPTFTSGAPAPFHYGSVRGLSGGTVLSEPAAGDRYTSYFYKTIVVTNRMRVTELSMLSDDAAFIYLNGVLIAEDGISGSDTFSALAPNEADESAFESLVLIGTPALQVGTNLLAVSVHQTHPDSTDLGFDLEMKGWVLSSNLNAPDFSSAEVIRSSVVATVPYSDSIAGEATDPNGDPITFSKVSGPHWLTVEPDGSLHGTPGLSDIGEFSFIVSVTDEKDGTNHTFLSIPVVSGLTERTGTSSSWSYLNIIDGVDPAIADTDFNTTWFNPTTGGYIGGTYDGPAFTSGATAPLSYGGVDGLSGGTSLTAPPSGSRHAVYFYQTIVVNSDAEIETLELLADDGAFVYLNGALIAMDGVNGSDTFKSPAANGDEDSYDLLPLMGLPTLQAGTNLLAISVHQTSSSSSDLGFDLRLGLQQENKNAPQFSMNPFIANDAVANSAYAGSIVAIDNDPVAYYKLDGPDWLIVSENGALSGTPEIQDMGLNTFTVYATDGVDGYNMVRGMILVNDPAGNPPPPASSTEHYRVTWDNDPTTTATIAWKQISGANGVVHYGTNDFGRIVSNYPNQKTVNAVGNYQDSNMETIQSCFARLTNLSPDTAYYFVIEDENGVSPRFWFLTAPDTPKPFTFIGGGDSRTNPTPRRRANQMVSKLRPLFVCFTGDMIEYDNAPSWNEWFADWQETVSNDGRIYPLIPHRGNHESEGNNSFFQLFDTTAENYYAFSVGSNLFRFYVLNSETTEGGEQGSWLANDLANHAANHTHLSAGYHKPMRPHLSTKSEGNGEYDAWAQLFYDHGMDLVFEADSHTVKRTWPLRPDTGPGSAEGFIRDDDNGIVFTGEGCWGAPLRPADDAKAWTRDAGMFNSFDWVHVYPSYMELYTVKVDNAEQVGRLREGDVFSLPSNIDLWKPRNGTRVIVNNHADASSLSYAQWQLDQWGGGNIPPTTEALADYDGDGYSNLTEFSSGLNPLLPATAETGVLPVISVASSDVEVSYRRKQNTSLTYRYEFSSDLITWELLEEGTDYTVSVSPAGDNEQVIIDLSNGQTATVQGFIRVNVGIQ